MAASNSDRAEWAEAALNAFNRVTHMDGEPMQTVMSDLLCNLMHLALQSDVNFGTALRMAKANFEHEQIYGD